MITNAQAHAYPPPTHTRTLTHTQIGIPSIDTYKLTKAHTYLDKCTMYTHPHIKTKHTDIHTLKPCAHTHTHTHTKTSRRMKKKPTH